MNKYKKILVSFKNRYVLSSLFENALHLVTILLLFFILYSFIVYPLTTSYSHYSTLKVCSFLIKIVTGCALIFFVIRFLSSIPSLKQIAQAISKNDPSKNEIILSALEFEGTSDLTHYSEEILDKAFEDASISASHLTYTKIFPKLYIKKSALAIIFAALVFLIVLIINPVLISTSLQSFINPESFEPHYDSFIQISPENTTILKGGNLPIIIQNYYPELIYTIHIEQQRRWKSVNVSSNSHLLYNITDSLRYSISNIYAQSDTFTVQVLEKPLIKKLEIYYSYPEYTKMSNRTEQDISGKIIAIQGTKIMENLTVNNELTEYRIVFSDGSTKPLEKIGVYTYRTEFIVEKSGSYHFYLKDILGNTNHIIERTIFSEKDRSPKIEIIMPAKDKILAQNMTEQIEFTTSDDYGIKKVEIYYKKNDNEYISHTILDTTGIIMLTSYYDFDVSDQNLLPGDVIFYYLKVYDNCTVPEANIAKTKIYLLKFPSIEELYEEIQNQQSRNMDQMKESLEESNKNKMKFDELRRKYLKNEELDWQEKETLKEVIKKQKELAQKAEETAKEYEKFVEELEKNQAVADQTLEKLKQIQEIMDEIYSPELEEAMKELQDQLSKISPEMMKQALDNFKFSQEEFNKKLDQTLQLLKKIQLEQKMQKVLQQAEELENLQKELNKQTSKRIEQNQDLQELASSQEDIEKKYQSLEKELAELEKELADNNEKSAAQEVKKALQQANEHKLTDALQLAKQQLCSQDENVKKKQSDILVGFSEIRNTLCCAQKKMQANLQTKFKILLKKTLNELLYFSKTQEKFLGSTHDAYEILDKEIAIYEGIKNSVNTLFSDPLIILMMDPKFFPHSAMALNGFEKIFDKLSQNSHFNVSKNVKEIYNSINLMIIDLLLSKSKQPQGSGGSMQQLLQQLQKMSQGQQALNMLTQSLFEQLMTQQQKGMGLTREQREMIDRIAGNEQQIKENFERMLRDYPEAEKLLGNMEGLKDDLKEVVEKMQKGIIDRDVIRKQNNILSRLLDAQRSIHERDFSRERESETPQEQLWTIPDDLTIDESNIEIKDILKYINENYPEEYHRLIKEYLEKIKYEN